LLGGLSYGVYRLPPVHDRLAWRIDNWWAQLKYKLNPPEEAIFVPQDQVEAIVQATIQAFLSTSTPTITPTSTSPSLTTTPQPTVSPTITPTPLPSMVRLSGVKYEDQHNRWNYCGPANLSMALTFWGWDGNRDVVGKAIKPSDKDKNVMPYEMVDFANQQSGLAALQRYGGDIDLLKRMVSAGFPVLTEKGYYEYDYNGKLGWMGHYQFVTGFDDNQGFLVVQDTYNDGPDFEVSYDKFLEGWRSFNYVFMVVYKVEDEAKVLDLLGAWRDPDWANRNALALAQQEVQSLTGIDQYFAAFNLGTSNVNLLSYADAAFAYDYAFSLYAALPDDGTRPFRMLWYQTGPYFAYYYSGRYQDVINLATTTLVVTISQPVLEESLYWRARAYVAVGDSDQAIADLRDSLQWHPGFAPSLDLLNQLGVSQ
jgi:tetratricopeptide (TPR) repeat protein